MANRALEKTRIQQIVTLHNQIIANLKRSLDSAIRIGQLLTEQKENLNHGEFGPWIKSNLPFTDRTARNYMRLHREKDRLKTETVSDLKSAYQLLMPPKEKPLPIEKPETLKLYNYEWLCIGQISEEITSKCEILKRPIKMDNLLAAFIGDPDLNCNDIHEIALTRDELTVEDYKKFLPLKIAQIKDFKKRLGISRARL